jgi:hypothetical protein
VRPFLREPDRHWRDGYSAAELAKNWIGANDVPGAVRSVLDTCDNYQGAELIAASFEKQVDLRTPGSASQPDILAIVGIESKTASGHGIRSRATRRPAPSVGRAWRRLPR